MNLSLAYLVKENPPHFWGLFTKVCHFSNGRMYGAFKMQIQKWITAAIEMLQQLFGYPCVEKFMGFIFMNDVVGELWIVSGELL